MTNKLHDIAEKAKASVLKSQMNRGLIPMGIGLAILFAFKTVLGQIEPGLFSWIASLPALFMVAITALARVNDIKPEQVSWPWQLRRLGLVMAGGSAVTYAALPFADAPTYPSWTGVLFMYSFAITWFTTPGMPPWHKYISGERKMNQAGQGKINDKAE